MKISYPKIYYKNFNSPISELLSATLENDFYTENLIGATSILEEVVPGRDIPYFYGISREPLNFEVTFAFAEPLTKIQIKSFVEYFLQDRTYQPLAFGDLNGRQTPIYYVIAEGDPEFEYIEIPETFLEEEKRKKEEEDTGISIPVEKKYGGYFKFNFRCNAPYGFEVYSFDNLEGGDAFTETFLGSLPTDYYEITIENNLNRDISNYKLKNETTNTSFLFEKIHKGEVIKIDGRNKRISSNKTDVESPYLRLINRNEGFIIVSPGNNEFTGTEAIKVTFTNLKMPRFI